MKVGIAADHGGFELKQSILIFITSLGHEVDDFGAMTWDVEDDYPDFVIPLARAVQQKKVDRGIAICGSGVGASIAANKIQGVRAALVNDHYSAHQGVEHDDMNLMCLGGRVTGIQVAQEYIRAFIDARFTGEDRHRRRLKKISELE